MATSGQDDAPAARRWFAIPRWLSVLVAIALMAGAVVVIRNELRQNDLNQILDAIRSIAPGSIAGAALLVILSYACLIGCERIALLILGRGDVPILRIVRATFTAYALGNAIGYSYATVPAARARMFKNDLSAGEVTGLSAITGAAVMVAGAAVAGLGLLLAGDEIAARTLGSGWMWRLAGAALAAPACAWVISSARPEPNRWLSRFNLQAPSGRMAGAQIAMGMADWIAAAGVLYILLPDHGGWTLGAFLAVFLASAVLGAASGAPAGLGVFEASILALSPDNQHAPSLAAALIVYRLVWTVAPLIVAAGLLVHDMAGPRTALKTP